MNLAKKITKTFFVKNDVMSTVIKRSRGEKKKKKKKKKEAQQK